MQNNEKNGVLALAGAISSSSFKNISFDRLKTRDFVCDERKIRVSLKAPLSAVLNFSSRRSFTDAAVGLRLPTSVKKSFKSTAASLAVAKKFKDFVCRTKYFKLSNGKKGFKVAYVGQNEQMVKKNLTAKTASAAMAEVAALARTVS